MCYLIKDIVSGYWYAFPSLAAKLACIISANSIIKPIINKKVILPPITINGEKDCQSISKWFVWKKLKPFNMQKNRIGKVSNTIHKLYKKMLNWKLIACLPCAYKKVDLSLFVIHKNNGPSRLPKGNTNPKKVAKCMHAAKLCWFFVSIFKTYNNI